MRWRQIFSALLLLTLLMCQDLMAVETPCEEFNLNSENGSLSKVPVYDQSVTKKITIHKVPLRDSIYYPRLVEAKGDPEKFRSILKEYTESPTEIVDSKDDTSICYGIVASQLIDAHRFSHSDQHFDHFTSPEYIAALYKSKYARKSDDLSWGEIDKAIGAAVNAGSCNQSNSGVSSSDLLALYDLGARYRNEKNLNERESLKNRIICRLSPKAAFSYSDFGRDLQIVLEKQKSNLDFLNRLMGLLCKNTRIPLDKLAGKLKTKNMSNFATSKKLNEINKSFSEKPKQPIAIAVQVKAIAGTGEHFHATIIAGQRVKDGKCQILIRDSYGKNNCSESRYSSEIECTNDGHYWVDREAFVPFINQITWISDKKGR